MTVFVDTNVLVYARDATEPAKQKRAAAWLGRLWRARAGRLSVQVLQEYYTTVTDKLRPGLSRGRARDDVRALFCWRPQAMNAELLERAWRLQSRHRLHWWDAQIVAGAQMLGCDLLLSEDFRHGQSFGDLRVASPFRVAPEEVFAS